MCYNIIRKREREVIKMKGLSNVLAKYFYDTCENIKNSKKIEMI